jgi:hypothetical protein
MRPLSLLAALLLLLVPASAALANLGHDSVAYDGASFEDAIPAPQPASGACIVKVKKVNFSAYGMVRTPVYSEVCGERDTSETVRWKRLEEGDEVRTGDSIITGGDALLTLVLNDGREVTMGENSNITIDPGYCRSRDGWMAMDINYGRVAISSRDGSSPADVNVSTKRTRVHTKGTVFTVESDSPGATGVDVVRVFKGAVEVKPRTEGMSAGIDSVSAKMMALTGEFEKKKITIKEFSRRAAVISAEMQKAVQGMNAVVTVHAGYECRVDDKGIATEPKRLRDPDGWFDR